uniref:Uncharacterized protein n=2 Tax=unclassified bacterial viruses TaxID=12333 RepID=A0A8S5R775_9VIRU|nr:MAG TPA: hypothetical protein [virus sp. cthq354]DAE27622.1 MAG TPA: hypothetical protein [virus sp. ctf7E27]
MNWCDFTKKTKTLRSTTTCGFRSYRSLYGF